MPDSEHVPNKPGKKNWVEKTGGLPEYINRIAKDLMDKGMSESHAIATAVNTVKKWARGGGGVTPKTRAKAAAALAEWESKKAASHVGLSTPTRLERTRHARLRSMDLAAVLDRASSIADPETRDRTTYRLLDLAGTQAPVTKSYNIDRVRDAYSGLQSKKRQAFYARQAKQREAAGTLGSPMIDSPSSGPAYRYVKEVWNTHLIVKDDNNGLFKVPYTVGNSGADISFGNEVPVTEQYVELSDPADGWLADLDNRGNVTALAGEVFDLAFGQAESSGTATTSAALKTAYTARDAKAAKAVARKRAAGSRKTKRRARKGSTLHATQVRVGAKMRAMAAAEAHPGQPASKAIRDAVKVHQAQERVQARTEATGSGTGGAKWAHGWVPLNDAAKKQVAANPEKFKQMRKKQKKQAKAVSLSAALDRAALIEDPAAKVAARLAILDLAKPGQRYRHGWIRIDGVPVGKSRPKVAGSRGRLVDGLTKEQHSARVDRIAAIPRTERTRKQQDQFVRSNAVLRGEAVPARSSAPVGAEAAASQAATSAGIEARKARKGLPARQTSGSTGGMTTHPNDAAIADIHKRLSTIHTEGLSPSRQKATERALHQKLDALHTERGQTLFPGLTPEAARHRSVQDHQYRTGAVTVGPNWERPSWYTGPAPKVSGPQGTQNRLATKTKAERQAAINANRAQDARETNLRTGASPAKASGPISMRQAKAELNTKDRKAADRLIAEMPKMETAHLQIAADSPSTSQKVKDAAHAELQKRYKENLHPGDSALKGIADAMKANPPGSRADTLSSGGANAASNLQTVPMSELSRLFNSSDPKVKEAARVEAVRRKNASMGRAADGVTPLSSPSNAVNARTISSTTASGEAPMDRGTFKSLGIKQGDPIEVAGPRGVNTIGTAVVRGGEVGVLKEDGTVRSLGGVATKVVARKVDHSKIPAMTTPAHPDAYTVKTVKDGDKEKHYAIGRDGKSLTGDNSWYSTEKAAKSRAESHRPPAHREPTKDAKGNASEGASLDALSNLAADVKREKIQKAQEAVHTLEVQGRDVDAMKKALADGDLVEATRLIDHAKNAPRGDDGNILPAPPRPAAGVHPEKFKPGEKPAVHKFMNTQRLEAIANGDNPEHAATAKAILQKRNKSTGITRGAAPADYDPSGRGHTARLLAADGDQRAASALRGARDTSSADITAARAARGQADTDTPGAISRISTSTLKNWQRSGTPSQKVMAAQELRRRDQPVRGGSVPPPRPIGGAQGQGSAQTGHRMEIQTLITERFPELKGKSVSSLRGLIANLEDKAKRQGSLMQSDRNRLVAARRLLKAIG